MDLQSDIKLATIKKHDKWKEEQRTYPTVRTSYILLVLLIFQELEKELAVGNT
jgi:hypothetical protein